jgi:hypothetical protein
MVTPFVLPDSMCDPAQIIVKEGHQLVERLRVAAAPSPEQRRDLAGLRGFTGFLGQTPWLIRTRMRALARSSRSRIFFHHGRTF